jgi:hypothetical protein
MRALPVDLNKFRSPVSTGVVARNSIVKPGEVVGSFAARPTEISRAVHTHGKIVLVPLTLSLRRNHLDAAERSPAFWRLWFEGGPPRNYSISAKTILKPLSEGSLAVEQVG